MWTVKKRSKQKVNDNCLSGMMCPNCKSDGPFRIEVKTMATVYDEGVEETEDNQWEEDSYCECKECDQTGTVKDFNVPDDIEETACGNCEKLWYVVQLEKKDEIPASADSSVLGYCPNCGEEVREASSEEE
jgi:RNase P subunit RPR2